MKPHAPIAYDEDIARAVQAWQAGKASEGQQRAAYQWVVYAVCDVEGMSYHEGAEDGRRASDFHEGRRFAGNQIRKMSNPLVIQALKQAQSKRKSRQEAKPND